MPHCFFSLNLSTTVNVITVSSVIKTTLNKILVQVVAMG